MDDKDTPHHPRPSDIEISVVAPNGERMSLEEVAQMADALGSARDPLRLGVESGDQIRALSERLKRLMPQAFPDGIPQFPVEQASDASNG